MSIRLQKVLFNNENGSLYVELPSENLSTFDNGNFILKRNTGNKLGISKEIVLEQLNISKQENGFRFILDINHIAEEIVSGNVWSLHFKEDDKLIDLFADSSVLIGNDYYRFYYDMFLVKPYITKDSHLAFWIKQTEVEYKSNIVSIDGRSLKIELELRDKQFKNCSKSMYFKNVDDTKLAFGSKTYKINSNKESNSIYSFELQRELFTQIINIQPDNLFAAVFVIEKNGIKIESPIKISEQLTDNFATFRNCKFLKGRFFVENSSLYYKTEKVNYSVYADSVVLDEKNYLEINIMSDDSLLEQELLIYDKLLFRSRKSDQIKKREITIRDNVAKFYLPSLFTEVLLQNGDVWDIEVRLTDQARKSFGSYDLSLPSDLNLNIDYQKISDGIEMKPYKTGNDKLALWTQKNSDAGKEEKIKIAVFGACYSRSAFTSLDYFNKDYKDKYQVVHTSFQPSFISLMSEPVNYHDAFFKEFNDTEKQYIKNEFEKSFFKAIEETKPDFLIIDLFADAACDLLKFGENQFITGNFYIQYSDYVKNLTENVEILNHDNMVEYMKYWYKSINLFKEKIKNYIPEDRIILQKARAIDRYFDENRNILYFEDELAVVKQRNFMYELMENYILEMMPQMQVIDVNDRGYIGHYGFPFGGKSINHFEPDYYKDFLKELDKLVLKALKKTITNGI